MKSFLVIILLSIPLTASKCVEDQYIIIKDPPEEYEIEDCGYYDNFGNWVVLDCD